MSATWTLFAAAIVLYAAFALRLGRWSISMPMVFVAVGYALGPDGANMLSVHADTEWIVTLTEITLALLLFGDASTLDLRQVREDAQLPLRLLTIGLLLTIALGALLGLVLLPAEGLAFAALLAAVLAPTDAALGLLSFSDASIPARIRRALNVESGLNDGIVTPFVALFLAFATATVNHVSELGGWLIVAIVQIALAVAVGTAIGALGGWLLRYTTHRGWTAEGSKQIAILGLALVSFFGAMALGGNGLIAAFVAGLIFGRSTRSRFADATVFTEAFSAFLSLLVWGIFGAVLLPAALRFTGDWRTIAYAVLSLTVIRMAPVALALIGTHLRPDTVAILGWFGPRGLASVVFTLLAFAQLEESGGPIDTLAAVASLTILLSVFAHGLTARPLSAWYARRLAATGGESAELLERPELRQRALGGKPRSA